MAFVPSEQQQVPSQPVLTSQQLEVEKITQKKKVTTVPPSDKISRIVKIVLKLAKVNAYDEEARILSRNGYAIERSNLISLLNHCMSVGQPLFGETEFIEQLRLAKIDPDLIINENVKAKLSQTYETPSTTLRIPARVVTNETLEEPMPELKGTKRPHSPIDNVLDDRELPSKRFHEDNE